MKTLTKEQTKSSKLSNLQIELLSLFQTNVDQKTLRDIRSMLKSYFAQRAVSEADKIWAKRHYCDKDMDKLMS